MGVVAGRAQRLDHAVGAQAEAEHEDRRQQDQRRAPVALGQAACPAVRSGHSSRQAIPVRGRPGALQPRHSQPRRPPSGDQRDRHQHPPRRGDEQGAGRRHRRAGPRRAAAPPSGAARRAPRARAGRARRAASAAPPRTARASRRAARAPRSGRSWRRRSRRTRSGSVETSSHSRSRPIRASAASLSIPGYRCVASAARICSSLRVRRKLTPQSGMSLQHLCPDPFGVAAGGHVGAGEQDLARRRSRSARAGRARSALRTVHGATTTIARPASMISA